MIYRICHGNATTDRYPLKIKIVKSSWYLNLRQIVRENREKLKQKRINKKKKDERENSHTISKTRDYETSNIWHTRDSEYWSWRRVKAWFREFDDEKLEDFELTKKLKFLGVK